MGLQRGKAFQASRRPRELATRPVYVYKGGCKAWTGSPPHLLPLYVLLTQM